MDVHYIVWKEEVLEFTASYTDATQGTIQVLGQVLSAENAKTASFSDICT